MTFIVWWRVVFGGSDALECVPPFGMQVFITVCECGYNLQQLVVVAKVVVMKNKYQLHFPIICTAASGPKRPHITVPLIAPLHSWRISPDQGHIKKKKSKKITKRKCL